MKIEYFLLKEEETEEFLAFETIHENPELKNFYEKKEKQLLETHLYLLNQTIQPFLEGDILALLRKADLSCLPIVVIDNKICRTGKLLSAEELSNLLEIGITIQKK